MPVITNKWVNSAFNGAATGTIGAGGAFPTGWSGSSSYSGVVVTWVIDSLTTTAGQYIMTVSLTVNNTSGSAAYINLSMGDIASVSSSTLHHIYEWLRRTATTGTSYFHWLASFEYTSGYSYLGQNTGQHNITASWVRGGTSFTTRATTGVVIPFIGVGVPTGGTYTYTLELSQPMFVQAATLGSQYYVPTTSSTPVTWSFIEAMLSPVRRIIQNLLR